MSMHTTNGTAEPQPENQAWQDYLDECRMLDEGCGCYQQPPAEPPKAESHVATKSTTSPANDPVARPIVKGTLEAGRIALSSLKTFVIVHQNRIVDIALYLGAAWFLQQCGMG